jgi:hypothetical protein
VRLHTPDRSFSQCATSFIGTGCPDIHHAPLFALNFGYCRDTDALLLRESSGIYTSCTLLHTSRYIVWTLFHVVCSLVKVRASGGAGRPGATSEPAAQGWCLFDLLAYRVKKSPDTGRASSGEAKAG